MLIQVGICSQTAVCVHKLHTPQREIQKNFKANNFQDFLQHSYFSSLHCTKKQAFFKAKEYLQNANWFIKRILLALQYQKFEKSQKL